VSFTEISILFSVSLNLVSVFGLISELLFAHSLVGWEYWTSFECRLSLQITLIISSELEFLEEIVSADALEEVHRVLKVLEELIGSFEVLEEVDGVLDVLEEVGAALELLEEFTTLEVLEEFLEALEVLELVEWSSDFGFGGQTGGENNADN
jgi:hypothetical protein